MAIIIIIIIIIISFLSIFIPALADDFSQENLSKPSKVLSSYFHVLQTLSQSFGAPITTDIIATFMFHSFSPL